MNIEVSKTTQIGSKSVTRTVRSEFIAQFSSFPERLPVNDQLKEHVARLFAALDGVPVQPVEHEPEA